jgi:hypothetical protein
MKKTLGYTLILLFLILLPDQVRAQEGEADPLPAKRVRGLRIGYDMAGWSLLYFDPGRIIQTLSIDYEAWQDIYPVIEFGFQNVLLEEEDYTYGSQGIFGRAGVDVNLLKYEGNHIYEMMYAGFRYGLSYFTHYAEDIRLHNDYYGGQEGVSIPENQLNAHWISVVGGVRVEVFNNFFMGWSVLANLKLAQVKDEAMAAYNIPGFGRGNRRTSLVFNYTLSYRIPLQEYTPRKIIKKREEPVPED